MSRRTANSKHYIRYKIKGIIRCSFLLYWFWHKSHYENVPFGVPESWYWCQFGEYLDVRDGTHDSPKYVEKGYPFVTSKNLNNGKIDFSTAKFISEEDHRNFSQRSFVEDGDILFAMIGSIGNPVLVVKDREFSIKNVALFKPYDKRNTYMEYILYYLLYIQENLKQDAKGGMQPFIPLNYFRKDLFIPLPPLNEQRRIVYELQKYIALINNIDSETIDIESHVSKVKSRILDLAISGKLVSQDPNDEPAIELLKRINPDFQSCDNSHYENLPENWCLAKVKDVFVINPRNKAEDNTIAGFIPMTLIDDGYSNTFSYEKRKWGAIKTGFTHFADGDVAVAKISPCLENRKSIVLRDLPNGIGAGTTELHVFRSSVVSPEYALYFFKSEYFISRCVGTFNGVVGQQRVGKNIIEEIQIPIPPINEQTKIVSTIETIFTQLNTITAEL